MNKREKPVETKTKRKMPAELRYGTRKVEELEELSRVLKLVAKNLDGALASAKKLGLKELNLDGVTKGDRGRELLKHFTANVQHSVNRESLGGL